MSRAFTVIPASTMLGGLAVVLARAEVRLVWGAKPEEAIEHALVDHPMAPDIERACRAAWSLMVQPIRSGS